MAEINLRFRESSRKSNVTKEAERGKYKNLPTWTGSAAPLSLHLQQNEDKFEIDCLRIGQSVHRSNSALSLSLTAVLKSLSSAQ